MRVRTDKYRFNCVWKASHYMLANLSEHLEEKVPPTHYLLLDRMYRKFLVPKSEVHICDY